MPDTKTDPQGFSTANSDKESDMGAKGGPTTSLGNADDKHTIVHPYDDDIQTQLAAKSTQNKKNNNDNDNQGKAS